MSFTPQFLDSRGHQMGCNHWGEKHLGADQSHVDFFCDCHTWEEPQILQDGTSIAWPVNWTAEMAQAWRAANGLAHQR